MAGSEAIVCVYCGSQIPCQNGQLYLYSCTHVMCVRVEKCRCGQGTLWSDLQEDEIGWSAYCMACFLLTKQAIEKKGYLQEGFVHSQELLQHRISDLYSHLAPAANPNLVADVQIQGTLPDQFNPPLPVTSAEVPANVSQTLPSGSTDPQMSIFQGLETLRSKSIRPWVCIKCKTTNPYMSPSCRCGFVNLKHVADPDPEELSAIPEKPDLKPSEEPNLPTQQCWKCESCSYDYNLLDFQNCVKCRSGKRSQPIEAPVASAHYWTCENCKYEYNMNEKESCFRCYVRRAEKEWQCKHCTLMNAFAMTRCEACNTPHYNNR